MGVTLENCTNSNPGQQWTVTNQNQLSATVNGCTDFQSAQRGLSAQWGEGCCLERLDSTVKLWSCDEYYTQIWSFESIQGPAPITGPSPSDTCAEIGCDADYHDELPCQCDSNCLSFDNCCSDFFTSCSGHDTCAEIGCGAYYSEDLPCQCDSNCQNYGNCCFDYETRCGGSNEATLESIPGPAQSPGPAGRDTCAEIGCGTYSDDLPCQCDSNCRGYGNCCSDFETRCGGSSEPTLSSGPRPVPTPVLAPSDTCAEIGCGTPFDEDLPCQCDINCQTYGTCCSDFETCFADQRNTCAEFGCGTRNDFHRCNCHLNGYGTRCSDFQALCVHDTCAEIGCNNFDDPIPRTCTCDPSCDFYSTCCPDYGTTCHGINETTLV